MGAVHPTQASSVHINPEERVVLDFQPRACCGKSAGFLPHDAVKVPPALAKAGVTTEQWHSWVSRYEQDVMPESNLCASLWLIIVCIIFFIPLFILMCCGNMRNWPFQSKAAAWLEMVNHDLHEVRPGLLAKWQTAVTHYDRYRVETTILSFALTEKEAAILDQEPVLIQGNCTCCPFCPLERDRVV